MPDTRAHRGRHPEDDRLFAPEAHGQLNQAVRDLSWLLSRGYAEKSSAKLVGDRYDLRQRQRLAVMRCACSDQALAHRTRCLVDESAVAGLSLVIDGYNVLTTVEVALAGGVLLHARDGCYRDIASMHGTFRQVAETIPAIRLIGESLESLQPGSCTWLLDKPVSNSGRLATTIREEAERMGWRWEVELVADPDPALCQTTEIAVTADSMILDHCEQWFNLAAFVVSAHQIDNPPVDMRGL